MYDTNIINFKEQETRTLVQDWEAALVVSGLVSVDGVEYERNLYFVPKVGQEVTALEPSTVLFTRSPESEQVREDNKV